MTEIRAAIERMDFRWDQGFITDKADYLEKRIKLQHELEQLSPIPDDDLERAADILANFGHYWEACGGDLEEQHRLIRLIVERVYVQGEAVVAMTLKADYHVVLGNKANEPTTLSVDSSVCACGDDGCLAGPGCDLFSAWDELKDPPFSSTWTVLTVRFGTCHRRVCSQHL
ncbi:MAG: hypothetical protein U0452_14200 [Anaerolineae bacterium]